MSAVEMPEGTTTRGKTQGHIYMIRAEWEADARRWIAHSLEVPGLAIGADTFEDLIENLKVLVPELLEENGLLPDLDEGADIQFYVMAGPVNTWCWANYTPKQAGLEMPS
jgi:predicted RNase H-like HicB family nuclease